MFLYVSLLTAVFLCEKSYWLMEKYVSWNIVFKLFV